MFTQCPVASQAWPLEQTMGFGRQSGWQAPALHRMPGRAQLASAVQL
jgi:hypothetical protein